MTLLAIDTATRALALALYDGHSVLAEQYWQAGNQHNALLAPAVQQMMAACGLGPADLSAVAVAHGPGSYTGLRIGMAFAKGVAAARSLPLIGVATLDILAAQHPISTRNRLLAVAQAGRGRIIAAQYQTRRGRWVIEKAPVTTDWQTTLAGIEQPTLIIGEVDAEAQQLIEQSGSDHLSLVPAPQRVRRPAALAHEAWQRWQAGTAADFAPGLLTPIYLQTP
jgi:tRNA threonylcarbamoyladenosine biosynthesis protein TsaB